MGMACDWMPVSNARKVFAVAVLAAQAWVVAPVAEAQPPIGIGAAHSQTSGHAGWGAHGAATASVAAF